MTRVADIVVIGGGIAGASVAWRLAADADVVLLEREDQPGYHATGRSAALFTENYGPPPVRAITAQSRPFLASPPAGFGDGPLMSPRPIMMIADAGAAAALKMAGDRAASEGLFLKPLSPAEACERVPVLRRDRMAGALLEEGGADIDVHRLLQGFLKGFARRGGRLKTGAPVAGLQPAGAGWRVVCADGRVTQARLVINAAGAWADEIASLAGLEPLGLVAKRRTAAIVAAPDGMDVTAWPAVGDIGESFYFEPDAGRLLISPADETPVPPQDVQPEELDIAVAVDRIERATTLQIRRIEHRWAGLRSFFPDHLPAVGFDNRAPGFFWLAGQGGWGIQTAPALSELAAGLARAGPGGTVPGSEAAVRALDPGRMMSDMTGPS